LKIPLTFPQSMVLLPDSRAKVEVSEASAASQA
jgi:hypothetical protein